MSGVRERLAAKKRRRIEFPVQLSDPGPALERLERAQKAIALLNYAGVPDDDERRASTQAELEEAIADRDEHFEYLQFQALGPDDFEALAATFRDDEGDLDTKALLAPLAAASAVDPDLQDEEYWAEQLSSKVWSTGEREQLSAGLLGINWSAPGAQVPKD